jgi:hypothetical protein
MNFVCRKPSIHNDLVATLKRSSRGSLCFVAVDSANHGDPITEVGDEFGDDRTFVVQATRDAAALRFAVVLTPTVINGIVEGMLQTYLAASSGIGVQQGRSLGTCF